MLGSLKFFIKKPFQKMTETRQKIQKYNITQSHRSQYTIEYFLVKKKNEKFSIKILSFRSWECY